MSVTTRLALAVFATVYVLDRSEPPGLRGAWGPRWSFDWGGTLLVLGMTLIVAVLKRAAGVCELVASRVAKRARGPSPPLSTGRIAALFCARPTPSPR